MIVILMTLLTTLTLIFYDPDINDSDINNHSMVLFHANKDDEYENDEYVCDYIHVKGLAKSGTTYLIKLLRTIEQYLCKKTNFTNNSYHFKHNIYSICKDWTNGVANTTQHTVHFMRHEMKNISQILLTNDEMARNSLQLQKETSQYFMGYNLYDLWKDNKFHYCVIIALRDPRNRVISRINTYFKKEVYAGKDMNDSLKNKLFMKYIETNTVKNENWYNYYGKLTRDDPNNYYLYFYEDIRMDTLRIYKEIIKFMGYYPLWINDTLIEELITETSIKNVKIDKFFVNKGDVCSYHKETFLFNETKDFVHNLMLKTLNHELIVKFNKTCPI